MKLIFLGKPGSGKGTQAEMISKEVNIPKIATGDLVREEIKKETELGKEISEYYNKGSLVPDEVVIKLMNKNLEGKNKFILDGFPRNLNQAKSLQVDIDKVFYLDCSDVEIMRRLINRRICPKCNKIYNLLTNPPKQEGICDGCNSKLIKRIDETKEIVKKRLEIYNKETMPVVNHYKEKGNLIEINGDPALDIVYNEIKSYLS